MDVFYSDCTCFRVYLLTIITTTTFATAVTITLSLSSYSKKMNVSVLRSSK